jgi:aldehyde:ferredoxin oxidoreductase
VFRMTTYGYGKILDVDLSSKKLSKNNIDPDFARKFIGGLGFSCKILYDEVGADVEPFSPENMLIFANGLLTGTEAPCSARTEVTTKSPLTGIIGTGNMGGMWGSALKHAGFDIVIVRNRSEKPAYLYINDDNVEIRDAGHLWGKDTVQVTDILKSEIGPATSVLTIGPAGENLVRFACPVIDYHHVAARNGSGAVMGYKNLKAIAVRGTGLVNLARPDEFTEAVKLARERLVTARKVSHFGGGNKGAEAPPWDVVHGSMPGKNFQNGFAPNWMNTHNRAIISKYMSKEQSPCWACPMQCFHIAEVNEGKYAGMKVGRPGALGLHYAFGGKCAVDNVLTAWKCKEICHQLGMDYVSAAGCISFAMELFQRGIISTKESDGLNLSWGNEDASVELLTKIAHRNGIGDILAEGIVRSAKVIGRGAEKYVMTTKGAEMMSTDPRSGKRGYVFGVITNPRGGDNIKGSHFLADEYNPDWGPDQIDMFENVKQVVYGVPPEKLSFTWEGKAMMVKWFEDLYSILNSVGVCFFPAGFVLALGPTHLSKLISACTGLDTTPEAVMKSGERVFNLLKAYNVRQGLTRKDDDWPDRFYEESLPEGPAKGAKLSRSTIDGLLGEYYTLRGWDKRTGIPSKRTLRELNLEDIADDLSDRGKLPQPDPECGN